MTKRIISILMILVMAVSFCACGMSEAEKAEIEYEKASRKLKESQKEIERIEKEIEDLERLEKQLDSYR